MRDNPKGSELDPVKGVRRCCRKNSPSVLSCIGRKTRKDCDRWQRSRDSSQRVRRRRASFSEQSLYYLGSKIWNSIPFEIKDLNLFKLKKALKNNLLLQYND